MRYRKQTKIKRKHHLIDELGEFLKLIEPWLEVSAINPGVIRSCGHDDKLKFTVQYVTDNGLKCLARSHGAVQEVFIVSGYPELVKSKIECLITS